MTLFIWFCKSLDSYHLMEEPEVSSDRENLSSPLQEFNGLADTLAWWISPVASNFLITAGNRRTKIMLWTVSKTVLL